MPAHSDTITIAKAGHDALRRGDAVAAREQFVRATSAGNADAATWLGLATACRDLKDFAASFAAVDRALALEPRNIQALIVRGDLFAEAGDTRAATAHYAAALRQAPAQGQIPPAELAALQRAEQMRERYANEYKSYLRARLTEKGFDPERSSGRFTQSFEMSMGRKKLYLQQPGQYYFPELPQI